jgi:cytochrome c-type biogenesis protein CcmH/NrfG
MLGKAYQKQENAPEAIKAFEKSISMEKKNYNAYFALGQINLGQGKYMSAANFFDQALKASPQNYLAAYNYAVSVESHEPENYGQNIEVWEKFVRMAKSNPKARREIGEAENHLKELREAHRQKELN